MPGYHLPLFTAAATGIWKKHGLDVELVEPFPGPDNARAVAAGRYDLCLTSVAHFLRAKDADPGLEAKFVFMVARRTHLAAFCIDGRGIESFSDLEGASILGAPESSFVRELLSLLDQLGLTPGPLTGTAYGNQFAALATGEGDVGVDFLDLLPRFTAEARPRGLTIHPLPFHKTGVDAYGSGLLAGDRLLESRPEAVRRAAAALREALLVTRDDPSAGLDGLLARYPETDRGRALEGWEAGQALVFGDGDLGAMDVETWERTIDRSSRTHGTPLLDPRSVFDDSFVPLASRA